MELWHGSGEIVPADKLVRDWPGVQPPGEISEYPLVVTRWDTFDLGVRAKYRKNDLALSEHLRSP
eukprot:5335739-Amphidinium_carterae.1